MPVEFLTDEQAEAYGKFVEEPTRPELERFFFLDDVDRELIGKRRGDHNRLGFALQMCTVRYLGLFLEDPLDVPWPVIEYLAEHLGVEDASRVKRYTERQMTAYEHAWEIRDAYGYHQFEDRGWDRKFRAFLHGRAWTQESRHKLARDICHGKRGQIMQAYRDGQEDQLGSLGLVLNAAVLWTTRYLDAAVDQLRALPAEEREHDVLDEDVARLSPLKHANLNCLGRYSFRASTPAGGGLRPLRDPATADVDDDDDGQE